MSESDSYARRGWALYEDEERPFLYEEGGVYTKTWTTLGLSAGEGMRAGMKLDLDLDGNMYRVLVLEANASTQQIRFRVLGRRRKPRPIPVY